MEVTIRIAQLLLSLSILVIIHEMGHYFFAKLFKTRVEKFYLFFDPWFSLFKIKKGETEYGVGWLPLGGYVKIAGMIDESMDREQMNQPPKPDEFRSKTTWQRLLIMVGGVLFNLIFAFILYTMILTVWGREFLPTNGLKYGVMVDSLGYEMGVRNGDQIKSVGYKEVTEFNRIIPELLLNDEKNIQIEREGKLINLEISQEQIKKLIKHKSPVLSFRTPFVVAGFPKNSPAEAAGIQKNDTIVGFNGDTIRFFDEFIPAIANHKNEEVTITVVRNNQKIDLVVRTTDDAKIGVERFVDFSNDVQFKTIDYSFFEAMRASIPLGYQSIKDQIRQLKLIPKHVDQVGGFIAIGGIFPTQWNWEKFWYLTAMLSIMLGVLNLLPIPALDGGHVMFVLFEMITRRKPSEKFLEYAQMVGFFILLALLVFANGNDILKLFK